MINCISRLWCLGAKHHIHVIYFCLLFQATKKFRFSEFQMRILKSHFATNMNPSANELMDIATEIDERLARVKVNILHNNYFTTLSSTKTIDRNKHTFWRFYGNIFYWLKGLYILCWEHSFSAWWLFCFTYHDIIDMKWQFAKSIFHLLISMIFKRMYFIVFRILLSEMVQR